MEQEIVSSRFDRVAVYDQMQKLAERYLSKLDQNAIAIFAKEVKRIVDNSFDSFVISQESYYTGESLFAIKDKKHLLAFTDIKTGYRSQM